MVRRAVAHGRHGHNCHEDELWSQSRATARRAGPARRAACPVQFHLRGRQATLMSGLPCRQSARSESRGAQLWAAVGDTGHQEAGQPGHWQLSSCRLQYRCRPRARRFVVQGGDVKKRGQDSRCQMNGGRHPTAPELAIGQGWAARGRWSVDPNRALWPPHVVSSSPQGGEGVEPVSRCRRAPPPRAAAS